MRILCTGYRSTCKDILVSISRFPGFLLWAFLATSYITVEHFICSHIYINLNESYMNITWTCVQYSQHLSVRIYALYISFMNSTRDMDEYAEYVKILNPCTVLQIVVILQLRFKQIYSNSNLFTSCHAMTDRYWHGLENSYTNHWISATQSAMGHVFLPNNNILRVSLIVYEELFFIHHYEH